MEIYVGSSYPRKVEAIALANVLTVGGHSITSRWLYEDEGYTSDDRDETMGEKYLRLREASIRDLVDLGEAESMVCLTDGEDQLTHGGRHSELGITLAAGKQVYIVGPVEQVFHYHPNVIQFESVDELMESICEN